MLPLALGLGAAACIGIGDFAAGAASRRLPPAVVGFWVQGIAFVLALLLLALFRPPFAPEQVAWGLLAGVCAGIGIALLYRGMALGAMSLVTPITACSVALPVIYSVISGEAMSGLEAAGVVSIIAGVVLAAFPARTESNWKLPASRQRTDRQAVVLAITAAVAFGAVFIIVDLAPHNSGWATLWTAGGTRTSAFAVQAALVWLGPWSLTRPGDRTPAIATAGTLEQISLVLVVLGAMTNAYGIVTALIGLYPVVTALLGVAVLGERLTRIQSAGAVLAMVGVVLVSI